ncbi:spore coat U domain-containing protein [Phyllobacterium sp. UNC302MFCol5.2]|uniref:Csu type fimbrial protein n=1 Tax=Phyllobacterium sp. UNC302MFCol5.2 TaxID=1449065 RepID=UPI0018CC0CC7|nr:spore coat U domain-containing protein [Phyllobacterium sp. UNC302MFCol5.2]
MKMLLVCLFFLLGMWVVPAAANASATCTNRMDTIELEAMSGEAAIVTFPPVSISCNVTGANVGSIFYACITLADTDDQTLRSENGDKLAFEVLTHGQSAAKGGYDTYRYDVPGTKGTIEYMFDYWTVKIPPGRWVKAGIYKTDLQVDVWYGVLSKGSNPSCSASVPPQMIRMATTRPLSVEIKPSCKLNVMGDLDFGVVTPVTDWKNMRASTALNVRCSPEANYTITVDNGKSRSPKVRKMYMAGEMETSVGYELYKDASAGVPWRETDPEKGTGTGFPIKVPVYGRITEPLNKKPAGKYSDTVLVTIEF